MQIPEHYTSDILSFFDGKPLELSLYQALTVQMTKALPDDICIKVQKTQISFYNRRLFASASLPVRRKKDWPRDCLVVTIGLPRPLDSPRAAVTIEPYPGRWTNHILVTRPDEFDGEVLDWLREAYNFAQNKR